MSDTVFRRLMDRLNQPCGDRSQLSLMVEYFVRDELMKEQLTDRPYIGNRILIDRTDHPWEDATSPEPRAVRGIFHRSLSNNQGCLTIGDDSYLLLGYEIPNQLAHSKRRADLVGLNKSGGLAVFEFKLENSYSPVAAALEGLDYLACLTSEATLLRLTDEFNDLFTRRTRHPDFNNIVPSSNGCHEVIVAGSTQYYNPYAGQGRGTGWQLMSSPCDPPVSPRIRFAEAENLGGDYGQLRWKKL